MNARPCIVLNAQGEHIGVRSILEAKWARFFTLIHLPWEYEPEVKTHFYRPDFLIGDDIYIEIKPSWHEAAKNRPKYERFSLAYPDKTFLLFCASPRSLFSQSAIFIRGVDYRTSPYDVAAIITPDLEWDILNGSAVIAENYRGEDCVTIGVLLGSFKFLNPFLPKPFA